MALQLVIDQGNTRLKLALFTGEKILRQVAYPRAGVEVMRDFLRDDLPERAIYASVGQRTSFSFWKEQLSCPLYRLDPEGPVPFVMRYRTPATLGEDRVALVAAAVSRYPGQPCLVLDAGTCLTSDFVDAQAVYHGGSIAPGLGMRYRAMADYTARLPQVNHAWPKTPVGDSTENAMRSGAAWGMRYEIEGLIRWYRNLHPQLVTVLTGGDAVHFEGLVKNGIFAAPDFLLRGLNHMLTFYAEVSDRD